MVTYPLSNHHRFLHTPSRQPISLCLVEGVMMGQDDRIDDRAAIETTPAGEFMPRRAQFKIIIPFSNHQPITTLTGHMAPPSLGWPLPLHMWNDRSIICQKKRSAQSRIESPVSAVCVTTSDDVPALIITTIPCIIVVRKRASARGSFSSFSSPCSFARTR